jgi:ribosomal protein S27E
VNLFVDAGPSEITPELVAAVCQRFGVKEENRDQITYSLLDRTITHFLKRGKIIDGGQEVIDQVGDCLGIEASEVARVTRSAIGFRKRAAAKRRKLADRGPVAPTPATLVVKCPKCSSTQVAAQSRGYSVGTGVLGWLVAGPIGALGGLAGASSLTLACLSCGHRWVPKPT